MFIWTIEDAIGMAVVACLLIGVIGLFAYVFIHQTIERVRKRLAALKARTP